MTCRLILFASLFIVSFSPAQKQDKNSGQFANFNFINKQHLHEYLSFISSDILQGRDTPSKGLDIAADYIASHLKMWGLKGGGDSGTYFQNIAMFRSKIVVSGTEITFNGKKYLYGDDFISTPVAITVTAPLVYVQNGYIVKAKNINPYKGIDVKGKIVVVLGGYAKGITLSDLVGKKGEDYDTPSNYPMNNGAAAVISIPSIKALNSWEVNNRTNVEKGESSVLRFRETGKQPIAVITASESMIDELFSKAFTPTITVWERSSFDTMQSFYFPNDLQFTISISTTTDTVNTRNVIGVLEGSDAKLKNQYVAYSAHYDHIGTGIMMEDDSIYNGADDNGSGTVALMACAEAFAKGSKPKRPLLFVWHTAEEKGLLGSKYFVKYPTIPLEKIITVMNVDMIGRSKPDSGVGSTNDDISARDEVFVIGSKMMSTELGELSEKVNADFLKLKFNYKFDNPLHPLKLFYRSDHYNYAKNNIPVIFYFDGIHKDYHQVTDEVEKIDYEKLLNVTKTIYAMGWKLANIPKPPVVDIEFPKDVFE